MRRLTKWQKRARRSLIELFPVIGPWTDAALWCGRRRAAPPSTPLEWEIDEICSQRLATLLLRYVRDERIVLTPALTNRLREDSFNWTLVAIDATTTAEPVLERLKQLHCDAVVSKGPGIAQVYPSKECRPYSDLDIIVPRSRFEEVAQAMEAVGFCEELRNRQPRGYMRRYCREGLNLVRGDHERLDLHHRIPPWIWSAGLNAHDLISRAERLRVDGSDIPCLSPVDNLMVAALHLVSDRNMPGKTLLVWRDVVELAHRVPIDEIVDVASRAGLAGWLHAVLTAMPDPMGLDGLITSLHATRQRIPHAVRLGALLSPRVERCGVAVTQPLRLPLLNGLVYLVGMCIPSRQSVREKYPDARLPYLHWWIGTRANSSRNQQEVRPSEHGACQR
jgi:hypothetical protein